MRFTFREPAGWYTNIAVAMLGSSIGKRARKEENKKDKKEGELAERSRFRKMPFRIHAAMQDADNLDGILGNLPIENDVASGAVFAIARPDVATVLPCEGFGGQILKATVQHRQVFDPLCCAPLLFGVAADVFQIGLGDVGQIKRGHQLGLSLSSSSSNPWSE